MREIMPIENDDRTKESELTPISVGTLLTAFDRVLSGFSWYERYTETGGYALKLQQRTFPFKHGSSWIEKSNINDLTAYSTTLRIVIGDDRSDYPMIILAHSSMQQLPSCCAMVVFSGARIHEDIRGKGLGKLWHQFRLRVAELSKYTVAICTIITNPRWVGTKKEHEQGFTFQEQLLRGFGWTENRHIYNKNSGNNVALFTKILTPSER